MKDHRINPVLTRHYKIDRTKTKRSTRGHHRSVWLVGQPPERRLWRKLDLIHSVGQIGHPAERATAKNEIAVSHARWDDTHAECGASTNQLAQVGSVEAVQPFRLALITAGQSPRPQILADLVAALPKGIEVTEFGALDTLGDAEISALAPQAGHLSIATRLRDGRRVMVSRSSVHAGIQAILSRLKPDEFDLAAIFCTGAFDPFPIFSSPCRLIQSQPAMENAVSMLVRAGHKIGVIVPYARHVEEVEVLGLATYQRRITWLDTSDESDWARVVAASADCEALVLNSVDYDEEAAVRLRRETGMPVILPRRVLASAIRLVLEVNQAPQLQSPAESVIAPLLERLTARERQVMWLMVDGLQSKQIGHQLQISPHTVSIHRANVLAKLGVPNTHTLTRLILGRSGHEPTQATSSHGVQ